MTDTHEKNQDVALAVAIRDIGELKDSIKEIKDGVNEIRTKDYVRRDEVESLIRGINEAGAKVDKNIQAIELDLAVFKTQIRTWGGAAVLLLGLIQYAVGLLVR